jgi:hypothetical protein
MAIREEDGYRHPRLRARSIVSSPSVVASDR